ncbi:hypothetical protein GCM10009430_30650 [Aquimarina litoralis]|uniref:Uncharacterized protein n=1 Tax=Aquimarina litoralis TaxID=584605 RepID=A0ABP3UAC6_9FLAO
MVQSFNIEKHLKANKSESKSDSKIVFFRDGSKQNKMPAKFLVNGKAFVLDKKEKIEIMLPSDSESLVEITNADEKVQKLINPNINYPLYYEISLNKKNVGDIVRRNPNSSFIKTRLKTIKLIRY